MEEIKNVRISPHVQSQQIQRHFVPISNLDEVTELAWENGQLSLHGLGGIEINSTWDQRTGDDTLESLFQQAGLNNFLQKEEEPRYSSPIVINNNPPISSSGVKWNEENSISTSHMLHSNGSQRSMQIAASSGAGKWKENSTTQTMMIHEQNNNALKLGANLGSSLVKKRVRSVSEQQHHCGRNNFHQVEERSGCASANANAAFCRDTNTNTMAWANSFESPTTAINGLDHECSGILQDHQERKSTNGGSFRSQPSARHSRAAAVHNQSERRRRDRINEKMKALQKLVPNANKTDKASMLDEVIEYLKQLQAQVQMMSTHARNMPHQMVMPLAMQQQLQTSLLARMGMGMPQSLPPFMHAATAPFGGSAPSSFVPMSFGMPPLVPPPLKSNVHATNINSSIPGFNDAYCAFLAQQSMNMDFLNKMAALQRHHDNQSSKKAVSNVHRE